MTQAEDIAKAQRGYSDEFLIASIAELQPNQLQRMLGDLELARRDRTKQQELALTAIAQQHKLNQELLAEQHQLDLKLVIKQVHWMQFSAAMGIVGTIIGVLLTTWLQKPQSPPQPQSSISRAREEIAKPASVDHKEKAELVPSKPPESKK